MAVVRAMDDLVRHDGERAIVAGRYRCVERPIRGIVRERRPADHAVIDLKDGTKVFLEPFDSGEGLRPEAERARFEGKTVQVHGIVHKRMPARGQSPLAPCISDITRIREDGEAGAHEP